jgi:pyrrolidone-carboxylate peptidase
MEADSFICNQVMYLALHWAARHSENTIVGFLHLPSLPNGQADQSCMPLADEVKAVNSCLLELTEAVSRAKEGRRARTIQEAKRVGW